MPREGTSMLKGE